MKKALIISCNDSYDYGTRTCYVEKVLEEKEYLVEHLLSDFDHRSKKRYKADRQGMIHYIHVPKYSKNLSFQRIWSHIRFGCQVEKFVMEGDYNLIYHCAPPNYTIKRLSKCKEKKGFKLITEIGDMWPESIPISDELNRILRLPFSIWSNLRDKYLDNSDVIIAECDLFRDAIKRNTGINDIQTLYFCKKYLGGARNTSYKERGPINLCYLGSINNIIDIEMIGRLIEEIAKKVPVTLHIIGDGENRKALIQTAENAGATVQFHGIVYDEPEKQIIFSKCHYALNIMKPEVFVGMTMKSLDYYSAGLPIINSIGGDVWKMIEAENNGFNITIDNYVDVIKKILMLTNEQYQELCKSVKLTHQKYFSIEQVKRVIASMV